MRYKLKDKSICEVATIGDKLWKKMTPRQKKPFYEQAAAVKKQKGQSKKQRKCKN